ncbi:MAG: hypothetical protein ACEQSE_08415 [Candidatus Aquirickettsiella gammari]
MSTLNQINVTNSSGLDASKYTVWVAGFMADATDGTQFQILQTSGDFSAAAVVSTAAFIPVSTSLAINVPNVTNSGNNRLVFTVTSTSATPPDYPLNGYTAYPFPGVPGVAPAGPYDIFEFGPDAQYDVSAVDSFGINLSFTVSGDTLTYGVMPTITRSQIAGAFTSFMSSDPYGSNFSQLLFTSPVGTGYPQLIEGQFSAIVSPKDWLAIYPSTAGLSDYWTNTVDALFTSGNQLSFYLNGATVGTYAGSSDGTQFTLSGPDQITVVIPKSDFAGVQPFVQAVRGPNAGTQATAIATMEGGVVLSVQVLNGGSGYIAPPTITIGSPGNGGMTATAVAVIENGVVTQINVTNSGSQYQFSPQVSFSEQSPMVYAAFGQIEAAIFEAFSRGVVLDGVVAQGKTIATNYSSDAWTNTANWYSNHNNAYNNAPSVYDAYAKFFHTGKVNNASIFGMNLGGKFAMAYGFSLDENPNVGSSSQGIPPGSWPNSLNVPAKTNYNVDSQTVSLTIGPWK